MTKMSFNAIRKNKILANISKTCHAINKGQAGMRLMTDGNGYLDLLERLELLGRPPKYRKDQRIIGKY